MAWHSEVLNGILQLLKPKVEEYMEDIIAILLRYEPLGELIAKNPDAFAAGLSFVIGSIPEMDKKTVLGRIEGYVKDVLESAPREVAKAAKGEGTTKKGIRVERGVVKAGKGKEGKTAGKLNLPPPSKKKQVPYLLRLPH